VVMKPIPPSLTHLKRREFRHHGRGRSAVGRTIRCSSRGEGHCPLFYSTVTDPGNGISPSPGSWRHSLYRKERLPAIQTLGRVMSPSSHARLPCQVCQCSLRSSWSSCSKCGAMPMPVRLRSLRHGKGSCGARLEI